MNIKKNVAICLMLTQLYLSAHENRSQTCAEPCNKFYGFVDALYWGAYEDGLDYAIKNNNGAVFINTCGEVERAEFNRNGGFRLGAGYHNQKRGIDVTTYWTRFHTHGSDSLSETFPVTLFPVWTNPGSISNSEQNAQACVRLDLDMFDACLHTWFSPTCSVDIMPLIGIAYTRINQVFNINANGAQSQGPFALVLDDNIDMCNNFWGVGPKIGMRSNWALGCGISAFGYFDLALLYGKFNIKQHEDVLFSNDVTPTTYLDLSCNRFATCRPRFDLMIGLAWEKSFCNGRYGFDLQAGWEQLYFFGQNQLMRFLDDIQTGANMTVNGDLAIQGLTVRVGFNF